VKWKKVRYAALVFEVCGVVDGVEGDDASEVERKEQPLINRAQHREAQQETV
jgi:hypothetical protein